MRRYLLLPLILLAYRVTSKNSRGMLLETYEEKSDPAGVTIYFGPCPGLKFGSIRLEKRPPTLIVNRGDVGTMSFQLEQDEIVEFYVNVDGELVFKRAEARDFIICKLRALHAFRIIALRASWPDAIKDRFNVRLSEAQGSLSSRDLSEKTASTPNSNIRDVEQSGSFIDQIPRLAELHVSTCKENFGIACDYSGESLSDVDKIISKHWDGPPALLEQVVMTFGSYVGETIRREIGGRWMAEGDRYALAEMGGTVTKIYPFEKIEKRFINGDEDSIACYYRLIFDLVTEQKYGNRP